MRGSAAFNTILIIILALIAGLFTQCKVLEEPFEEPLEEKTVTHDIEGEKYEVDGIAKSLNGKEIFFTNKGQLKEFVREHELDSSLIAYPNQDFYSEVSFNEGYSFKRGRLRAYDNQFHLLMDEEFSPIENLDIIRDVISEDNPSHTVKTNEHRQLKGAIQNFETWYENRAWPAFAFPSSEYYIVLYWSLFDPEAFMDKYQDLKAIKAQNFHSDIQLVFLNIDLFEEDIPAELMIRFMNL